jgi:hypothetical protein
MMHFASCEYEEAMTIRLDEPRFTMAEAARISGVPLSSIRNWQVRGTLRAGVPHFTGRHRYSLAGAVRLAAMHDLTIRVPLRPADAVGAAELVVRRVLQLAPRDADGYPLTDLSSISRSEALVLAVIDGEMHVGLVDAAQPGGYVDFSEQWARAHVVVPIAALLAAVLFRSMEAGQ